MNDYQFKKEKINAMLEYRKSQLIQDPIAEYVKFVQKKVCEILGVKLENLMSPHRGNYAMQARVYAIEIIVSNTDLGSDVMYFFDRHRTTYYNTIEKSDGYKKTFLEKKQWQACFSECSMSAFNRAKK